MSQKVKIKFDDIFDNKLSSDEVLKYLIELHEKVRLVTKLQVQQVR